LLAQSATSRPPLTANLGVSPLLRHGYPVPRPVVAGESER